MYPDLDHLVKKLVSDPTWWEQSELQQLGVLRRRQRQDVSGSSGLAWNPGKKLILPAPIVMTRNKYVSHYIVYLDASTFVSFKFEAARATGWTLMAAPFPNEPLPPNCSLAGWRQLSSVTLSFPETRQNGLQNNWLLSAHITNIQEIEQHRTKHSRGACTKDVHPFSAFFDPPSPFVHFPSTLG